MKLSTIKRNDRSTTGVWWDFETGQRLDKPNEHLCVRIAEKDNPQHRASLARLQLEHVEALRQGGDAAAAAWQRIVTRALSESILVDWANVDGDDDQPIAYTADAAEKVLADATLWPFRHFVEDTAGIIRSYRLEHEEAAKGN